MSLPDSPHDLEFESAGTTCRTWHLTPGSPRFEGPDGATCVDMAHGFGATREARLLDHGRRFSQAGELAEIKRYPIGHFDIYLGKHFEKAVADQLAFLSAHL